MLSPLLGSTFARDPGQRSLRDSAEYTPGYTPHPTRLLS